MDVDRRGVARVRPVDLFQHARWLIYRVYAQVASRGNLRNRCPVCPLCRTRERIHGSHTVAAIAGLAQLGCAVITEVLLHDFHKRLFMAPRVSRGLSV